MRMVLMGFTLAFVTGAAIAQDGPPPPPGGGMGQMMRADSNGDGVITREESLAQAAQRFDRLDANRDGRLTRDELERVGRAMGRMRGDMPPPPPPPPPPSN